MSQDSDDAGHVMVKAVKHFVGDEGMKDETSAPFKVTRRRAADLKANRLVQDHVEPRVKVAPVTENKMQPQPENKAAPLARGRV